MQMPPTSEEMQARKAARMEKIVEITAPAALKTPSPYYRVWFRDRVLQEFETQAQVDEYLTDLPIQVVVTTPQTK
jgi:hypothetical protein